MIKEFIFSYLIGLAFSIIFNIHGKKLIYTSLGSSVGWVTNIICIKLGLSTISSMFFASIALTVYSELFARIIKTPVTTLIIPALIPLVPGGGMYNTMLAYVKGDIQSTVHIGIETFSVAGALAIGILFVSSVMKLFTAPYRKKH